MSIISLSGFIGSGKDTVAEYLEQNHGYYRFSLIKSLRDSVASIFGWDRDMLDGRTPEAGVQRNIVDQWWTDALDLGIDITPRWVLQNLGTEVMRNHFHPDIWMLSSKRWLSAHKGEKIVIADARFLNELGMLQDLGAFQTGIYRTVNKGLKRFYEEVEDTVVMSGHTGPFAHMRVDSPVIRNVLAECVDIANDKTLKLHASEVQHLVWPWYDTVFDNTKSKKHLYAQVESFLFNNDLG